MGEDVVDIIDESHVEHLVGLVEDYSVNLGKIYYTAVDKVDKSARGSHDNLHTLSKRAYLALYT